MYVGATANSTYGRILSTSTLNCGQRAKPVALQAFCCNPAFNHSRRGVSRCGDPEDDAGTKDLGGARTYRAL
jgi:hypothetical protein